LIQACTATPPQAFRAASTAGPDGRATDTTLRVRASRFGSRASFGSQTLSTLKQHQAATHENEGQGRDRDSSQKAHPFSC